MRKRTRPYSPRSFDDKNNFKSRMFKTDPNFLYVIRLAQEQKSSVPNQQSLFNG